MIAPPPAVQCPMLSEDCLDRLFSFLQRVDARNLCSAYAVCSAWTRVLTKRAIDAKFMRLESYDLNARVSFVSVIAPFEYVALVRLWEEMEALHLRLSLFAIHPATDQDVNLSPSLTRFAPEYRDWYVHTILSILSGSDAWKRDAYLKNREWRLRLYGAMCACLDLPPDPQMLRPVPVDHMPLDRACIVVDMTSNWCDGLVLQLYSPHHDAIKQVPLEQIERFVEVRCGTVWGAERVMWVHDNALTMSRPWTADGVYRYVKASLNHSTRVPPDCASVACLYALVM